MRGWRSRGGRSVSDCERFDADSHCAFAGLILGSLCVESFCRKHEFLADVGGSRLRVESGIPQRKIKRGMRLGWMEETQFHKLEILSIMVYQRH